MSCVLRSDLNVILVASVLVPAVIRCPRVERYGLLVDARATLEHEAVEDFERHWTLGASR